MKRNTTPDWDWEKKPKKIEKGTNKSGKHRKSIYNMLSDLEEDEFDSDGDDVRSNYTSNFSYDKRR